MADDLYCIDASSLIRLKQDLPRRVFPTVWEKMEELIRGGRLIAPDEVFREVEKDELLGPWAKQYKKMFRRPDQEQIDAAKEVTSRFPALAKPGRFGPAADPFVVGLAPLEAQRLSRSLLESQVKCIVVTEDGGIRRACARLGMGCVSLVEAFEREAWVFR